MLKSIRKTLVGVLSVLTGAVLAVAILFSAGVFQGDSALSAYASEITVTPQTFGSGTVVKHQKVNDMVGMSVSWGKKTYVNDTRRTIANNSLSSATVHSIWTADAKNKNLAGSESYVKTGTFARHEGVKYYEIPGNSNKHNSSEAWRAAINAAMKGKNTYDTAKDSATYGEYTSWNYVLVRLANDWTATEITGAYSWSSNAYQATRATSFEVDNGGKVVTYTSDNGDNLYNNATMGSLGADDVPSAPFTHGRLGIPNNTYVILDLNGHKIDRNLKASTDAKNAYQYPSVFAVGTGARLEVFDGTATDSNPVGTGSITGGNGCLSQGSYANENKGGAFHLADNSEVTLHSGTATGGSTCLGGAVYLLGNAIFNLYEGRLTGNTAHRGGAVYLAQGSYSVFNMYGGEISSCATLVDGASRGGAVCVYENAFCNIYGGKICNNVAVWGGGISVDTKSYVKLYGGEISGNGAVKQGPWGASGAGVNLLAESYGVYINGPATVKGNYTLKDEVLSKFRGVNGVGSQTVTAVANRMTMNITLELEGGGNKVLENYEVAGNLFLSKKNTNNQGSAAPTNPTLGYAEIKVQGVLSKGGKNAEVYVSPDGGTEGNHFGKIMHGFITSGYDDSLNQQNTGRGEVKDPDVWTNISGDEYQYTSYLCGNAVGNYFKSDSGADIIETLDGSNARWVEITDLTKARTADVTWEYYDGTEPDGERLEENWKLFSAYPENIPPSAVYDDKTNWLGRVRFVFNKFRDTDSNGYCDLMERFVVEYGGTDELFKYTKTTYRFKKGTDTANNGDKKAENYELDGEIPALVKSGAWIESSVVYCDGERETFEKGKVPKGGIKEAGTYTFSIGAAAKPGSSPTDDTVFSPSDVLTDKLEKVQLKVAQRGLTVTGVAISKVYDGKVDVSEDLNNALASDDAATRIAPTIAGGWLAQHYGQIRVAAEEPAPFKGVILDSPDVGTHISTRFESLSLTIKDLDGSDKISRNYIVSGELSNITVDITPRVLKKEDFSWGGNSVEGDTDAEDNPVSFQWDGKQKFLTAVYTGQPKNPVISWTDGAILTAESRDAADSVVLEYGGTQSVANSKPGGELFGEAYQASAKITTQGQGGNYVFARYNADGSLIEPFQDGKYAAENTTTTVEVEFRIEQAPLTVEKWNVSDNATTAWKGTEATTSVGYYYNGNTPQSEVGKEPVILFPKFKGIAKNDATIGVADVQLIFGGNSAATPGGAPVTVTPQLKNQEGNYYIDDKCDYFTLNITIEKRLVTVKVFDGTGVYGSNDRVAEHYTDYGLRTGVHLTEHMGASKDWDYAPDSLEFLGSDAENILLCLDEIDTTGYDVANKEHWTAAKYAAAGSHTIKCQFIEKTDLYEVVFLNSAGEAKEPKFEITPATITTGAIWTIEHVYKADGYPVEITADMITLCGDMKFADAKIEYTQTTGTTLSPDDGKYTAVEAGRYTFSVTVTVANHGQFTHELIIVISSEHVYISLGSNTIDYTYGDKKLTRKILQALKDGTVGGVDAAYDDWLLDIVFTEKYITEINGFSAGGGATACRADQVAQGDGARLCDLQRRQFRHGGLSQCGELLPRSGLRGEHRRGE